MKPILFLMAALWCAGLAAAPGPSPAAAPAPGIDSLFQQVNTVAEELQASLTELESSIEASRTSMEKGAEVLDAMLASVSNVHQSMAEDSPIWQELDAVLQLWEQRRKETLAKSETNPAFQPIAQAWQTRLETARQLRNQISNERANSLALMRAIEADREIVLAHYELGQAEQAIEGLKRVSANLTSLNENMKKIVDTASDARQAPIPQ